MKKIAVLSDVHAPFQDDDALDLFIKVVKAWKPDILVSIGDIADVYSLSAWPKDPGRNTTFLQELEKVHKVMDRIDNLAPRKIFTEGNHEDRLRRYVFNKSPELYGYLTVQTALQLEARGWEYYPYQEPFKYNSQLHFVHDMGKAGATATKKMTDNYPINVVFGHTHRLNCFTRGNLLRNTYTAWNCGWLGDPRYADYKASVDKKQDWIKGFVLVHVEDDGTPHFEGVKINHNKCLANGKLYDLTNTKGK